MARAWTYHIACKWLVAIRTSRGRLQIFITGMAVILEGNGRAGDYWQRPINTTAGWCEGRDGNAPCVSSPYCAPAGPSQSEPSASR